ncbi:ADP-ribosylation [Hypoxylon crocopeplum]|nr:ADP-ribosylation [Hypoxylon crocopeplum]
MSDDLELSEDDLVELSLLRDFEIDELVMAGFLSEDEQLTAPLDEELIIRYDRLNLHVIAGPLYPAVSVTWRVDNYTLSRGVVDELRMQLREIVEAAAATNNISRWKRREEECESGIFEPTKVVLELAKRTATYLKSSHPVQIPDPTSDLPFERKQASSSMTSSEVAFQYLQQTPQQICSHIPDRYRVLHVEEILRTNIARKFHERREKMRKELLKQSYAALRKCVPPDLQHSRRKELLVEYLVKPRVTFHGTSRQYVPSIVRHGFLKPGKRNPSTGERHMIRCGATYGQGIYSSPNPDFSLSYTDWTCHATKPNEFFGIKLLVCATLMGRSAHVSREDNWRYQTKPYPEADSHVANRELEYIVFDTAQILPVYVIHIDWGQHNALHFVDLPSDPRNFVPARKRRHPKLLEDVRWPAEIQRQKAASLARASKYFPYGYGPATGGKFVVEEIGEVDEDDEEYGDYQALRGEELKDKTNLNFWSWVKVGEELDASARGDDLLDEYNRQRTWHGIEAVGTMPAWDEIPEPGEKDDDDNEVGEDDDFGISQLMV